MVNVVKRACQDKLNTIKLEKMHISQRQNNLKKCIEGYFNDVRKRKNLNKKISLFRAAYFFNYRFKNANRRSNKSTSTHVVQLLSRFQRKLLGKYGTIWVGSCMVRFGVGRLEYYDGEIQYYVFYFNRVLSMRRRIQNFFCLF